MKPETDSGRPVSGYSGAFPRNAGMWRTVIACGALAAAIYLGTPNGLVAAEETGGQAVSPLPRLLRHAELQAMPDIAFKDAAGTTHRLTEWRGKTVLVNLWATWCGPCKAELPSLGRLQAKLGGDGFAVVAVSTDRSGPKAPAAFLAKANIDALALYNDDTAESAVQLKAEGLPLSVIVDPGGREIARLLGPADWDSVAATDAIAGFLPKR